MNKRLGILGGGQLGQMLALAAHPLGLSVAVVDPNPQAPARAVARHVATPFDDPRGLEQLRDCDWVTFEFENVPDTAAAQLAQQGPVFPPVDALRISQDRFTEKNAFQSLGIPTVRFLKVDDLSDAQAAFAELGPMILKTRRFGYDGKGQAVVRSTQRIEEMYGTLQGAPAIAEQLIHFDRELSIVACRSSNGEVAMYPLVENVHREGILRTTLAPATNVAAEVERSAQRFVQDLMHHLNYVGVLALELFEVQGKLIVNEYAPRVHNSGHWTIEGAFTSQFENHVRAVCGLPLGDTGARGASVMTNLIGAVPPAAEVLKIRGAHLHDYGKQARDGRKVGHVTILGSTLDEAQKQTELLLRLL